MPRKTLTPLPPLPFGQTRAVTDTSLNSLRDHIERVMPGIETLDANGSTNGFQCQSLFAQIGELRLSAQSHHPISLERQDCANSIGLLVPFGGQGEFRVAGKPHVPRSGQVAVFLSGAARTVKTNTSSEVLFHLDESRLMATAAAMRGLDHPAAASLNLQLTRDREIPLQGPSGDFQALFRHALGMIDALQGHDQALTLLGLEETMYRGFVMLLCPDLFQIPQILLGHPPERRRLDELCDFIRAHLDQPLNLTLLEKQSGLSARSLQLAFQKTFGISPMAWIRNARLDQAHDRLIAPTPEDSVMSVALDCGFPHLSDFARRYRMRFGECPSLVLRRARRS